MQVRFQQLCLSQPGKFKKDGVGRNKGNGNGNKCPWGTLSSRAHVSTATNRGTRQATAQTRKMIEATISKPAAQTSKGHDRSRASATSAVRRATKGLTAQNVTSAATAATRTRTAAAMQTRRLIMLM